MKTWSCFTHLSRIPIYEILTHKQAGSWDALDGDTLVDQAYNFGSQLKIWAWSKKKKKLKAERTGLRLLKCFVGIDRFLDGGDFEFKRFRWFMGTFTDCFQMSIFFHDLEADPNLSFVQAHRVDFGFHEGILSTVPGFQVIPPLMVRTNDNAFLDPTFA